MVLLTLEFFFAVIVIHFRGFFLCHITFQFTQQSGSQSLTFSPSTFAMAASQFLLNICFS